MGEVTQHNEGVGKESNKQGKKSGFKTIGKKIKEGTHKIWEDLNSPLELKSYHDLYKDKPDKLVISQTAFYYPQDMDSVRETIRHYYDSLKGDEKPDWEPFLYTMFARGRLQVTGLLKSPYISVVDFSKPNTQHRLFVINLKTLEIENAICVGHGKNSGDGEMATQFSNEKGSMKSSLGAFLTDDKLTYNSKGTWKGLSLMGWEDSNYRAESRGLYMHPGGVDQSEGCFTIPYENDKQEVYDILEKLKGESLVYSYYSSDLDNDSRITNPNGRNIMKMKKMSAYYTAEMVKSVASKAKSSIIKVFSRKNKDKPKN